MKVKYALEMIAPQITASDKNAGRDGWHYKKYEPDEKELLRLLGATEVSTDEWSWTGDDAPTPDDVLKAVRAVGPVRRKLVAERPAITHKFSVANHEGYFTVGMFPDGKPGELFITMSKEGSTVRGLMDSIAKETSLLLQYGVPIDAIADKHRHQRFEPSGFTGNEAIPKASSIVDYVFHWLVLKFGEDEQVKAWEPEPDMTKIGTDAAIPVDPTK